MCRGYDSAITEVSCNLVCWELVALSLDLRRTLRETLRRLTYIMLSFLDRANAITMGALLLSCAVVFFAIQQFYVMAVIALIGAGLCDLFDGVIARRLNRSLPQKIFGQRLDSLVDACAFGMAPLVLCFKLGLSTMPDGLLLAFFVCCVVWRLMIILIQCL